MIYFFLVYLFLELYISVQFTLFVGVFWMFMEILLSAFVGILILKNLRFVFYTKIYSFSQIKTSGDEFLKSSFFSFLGAVFLIMPGIVGDIIGILLQVNLVKALILNKDNYGFNTRENKENYKEEIIDVEIIESDTSFLSDNVCRRKTKD